MEDISQDVRMTKYGTMVGFFAAISFSKAAQSGFKSDENEATDTLAPANCSATLPCYCGGFLYVISL